MHVSLKRGRTRFNVLWEVGMRRCVTCGAKLSVNSFYKLTKPSGRVYRRRSCGKCTYQKEAERRKTPEGRRRQRDQRKTARENRVTCILRDSKNSDRKRKMQNDLTRAFIAEQIAQGCAYCGDQNAKMTLDRQDNTIGHLQTNVRSACCRCNSIRRSMPFPAWELLVPAIRRARESGLFGTWEGIWNHSPLSYR